MERFLKKKLSNKRRVRSDRRWRQRSQLRNSRTLQIGSLGLVVLKLCQGTGGRVRIFVFRCFGYRFFLLCDEGWFHKDWTLRKKFTWSGLDLKLGQTAKLFDLICSISFHLITRNFTSLAFKICCILHSSASVFTLCFFFLFFLHMLLKQNFMWFCLFLVRFFVFFSFWYVY